jgi:hypothetical protein
VITGAVFGSFLAANAQPAYVGPAYGTIYTPTCWMERQFAGYDYYSRPVYNNVQICR